VLPHPFNAGDTAAGYRYELSVLQAEFSVTQVLDSPVTGRIFFDQLIRDNLDTGRPDRVSLIFDRRIIRKGKHATPGRFRTRVITDGVTPSLHIDYKDSRIKQYHKLGRALRTETTINDPRDFGVAKGLSHLPQLKEIGFTASRRLLDVQRISHDPAEGAAAAVGLYGPPGFKSPILRSLSSSYARALRLGGLLSAFQGVCVAMAAIRPLYLIRCPRRRAGLSHARKARTGDKWRPCGVSPAAIAARQAADHAGHCDGQAARASWPAD